MKTFFDDIFYPASEVELNKLISFENSGNSKVIIIPHAGLENINQAYNIAFSAIKRAKRYVFIAPMHNGKYPDSESSLFTISSCQINGVNCESVNNLTADDSILEEEYTLELATLFISKLDSSSIVLPIFTALEFSDEIKKLKSLIRSLDDGDTSFIISANFSEETNNEKAKEMAKTLIQSLNEQKPLVDDEKKGIISGCGIKILEAFRNLYSSFIVLGFQDGSDFTNNIEEIKGNIIHLAGAFND